MLTIRFVADLPIKSARAIALPSDEAAELLARIDEHDFSDEPEKFLTVLTEQGWRVLVGLGKREDMRRIGGALFAELAQQGMRSLAIDIALPPRQLAELAYGMLLRAWRPAASYRQTADPEKIWHLREVIVQSAAPEQATARFAELRIIAEAVHFVRDLVVAPASHLTPPAFVEALRAIPGVGVEIVDPEKAGLTLLQAVGQGSLHKPHLVILRWQGAAPAEPSVMFVGKGITFDTGGIDIKPRLHLEEMKGDMAGAAAVAGVLRVLAARCARINAIGVLAIAENMPSGRASRPGDVVRSFSGRTVEIIDTDAEGRLVLADALAYGASRFKPSLIVDLATLTGAVEVTLGFQRAGLFCADDLLAERLFAAGEAEGEKLWRLPLTDLYDDAIASPIADLRNCSSERGPDALHAARFLQHFVPDGVAWAHLDIAGLAEAAEDEPLAAEGPTGFGVRLLDRLVRDHYERSS